MLPDIYVYLRVENLHKSYGNVEAIKDVSFSIAVHKLL